MKVMRANGTIRVGRFVTIDVADNNSVNESNGNEQVVGISDMGGREAPIPSVTADPPQAAQAGDSVAIHEPGATNSVLLYLGTGGCTAGDRLESDADGAGVTMVTTAETIRHIGAIAQETGSAGEYVKVIPVIFTTTNPA